MNKNEIIKIIQLKDNWESNDLIKAINEYDKKQVNIKFCYIGGYELLRDGTKTQSCKSLEDVQCVLDDWEIDYDTAMTDPVALAKSVQTEWKNTWNDGGGSAWIEF